jgi:hypothetical protein
MKPARIPPPSELPVEQPVRVQRGLFGFKTAPEEVLKSSRFQEQLKDVRNLDVLADRTKQK